MALDDVTLRLERGEFLAIAGPSGTGKSTLLNLIGCIDSPSSGRIRIEGIDTSALKPAQLAALRRKRIGFVFQTFNLIPVFTAWENVEFPLLLGRVADRDRKRRVENALESVGLADRARHRPDLLSGANGGASRSRGRSCIGPRWYWPTSPPLTWTRTRPSS